MVNENAPAEQSAENQAPILSPKTAEDCKAMLAEANQFLFLLSQKYGELINEIALARVTFPGIRAAKKVAFRLQHAAKISGHAQAIKDAARIETPTAPNHAQFQKRSPNAGPVDLAEDFDENTGEPFNAPPLVVATKQPVPNPFVRPNRGSLLYEDGEDVEMAEGNGLTGLEKVKEVPNIFKRDPAVQIATAAKNKRGRPKKVKNPDDMVIADNTEEDLDEDETIDPMADELDAAEQIDLRYQTDTGGTEL